MEADTTVGNASGTMETPWTTIIDPSSGRTYWHNPATDETTWSDPSMAAASWTAFVEPSSGRTYWHNPKTGETSWGNTSGQSTSSDALEASKDRKRESRGHFSKWTNTIKDNKGFIMGSVALALVAAAGTAATARKIFEANKKKAHVIMATPLSYDASAPPSSYPSPYPLPPPPSYAPPAYGTTTYKP